MRLNLSVRWRNLVAAPVLLFLLAACSADTSLPAAPPDPLRPEAIEFYEQELAAIVEDDVRPQYRCAVEALIDVGGAETFLQFAEGESVEQAPEDTRWDIRNAYRGCDAENVMVAVLYGGGPGFGNAPVINADYVDCVEAVLGDDRDDILEALLGLREIEEDQRVALEGVRNCPIPSSGPQRNIDHWHSVYGVYSCSLEGDDKYLPPFQSVQDDTGLHSHGDGLIHIHPFFPSSEGENAQVKLWVQEMGSPSTATRSWLRTSSTPAHC